MPPHLFSSTVPVETGPTAATARTFGEWPNSQTKRTTVPSGASLIGDHLIAGNYSPDIKFPLTQIGTAHPSTPVTNSQLVCRLLLSTKTKESPTEHKRSNMIYDNHTETNPH